MSTPFTTLTKPAELAAIIAQPYPPSDMPDMEVLSYHLKKRNLPVGETFDERIQTLREAGIEIPSKFNHPPKPEYSGNGTWDATESRRLYDYVLRTGPGKELPTDHLGCKVSWTKTIRHHNPITEWGHDVQQRFVDHRKAVLRFARALKVTCHEGYCFNESAAQEFVAKKLGLSFHEVANKDFEYMILNSGFREVEEGRFAVHNAKEQDLERWQQLRLGAKFRE